VNDVLLQQIGHVPAHDFDHEGLKILQVLADDAQRENQRKFELGF
jgi:hypothetical protein